jgi:flagellar protein FliJ
MKPFSMHAVLKFRKQLEDNARQQLYQALELEARLLEATMQTEEALSDLYHDAQRDKEQGTSIDRMLLFDYRIDLVKQQLEEQRSDLEKQQAQVGMKRQQLVKASKDRKVMEKLKEQQNAAHARFLDKKEMAMLDEIAVLSHERNRQ